MLLSDIQPINRTPDANDSEIISHLFNGDADVQESKSSSLSSKDEEIGKRPLIDSSTKLLLFVTLIVFVSLAIESPTKFTNTNKFYLYIITSVIVGLIVWMFEKKIR